MSARLDALAEDFLDDRRTLGRGLSANSEAAYRRDLATWAFTIGQHTRAIGPDEQSQGFPADLARVTLDDLTPENLRQAYVQLVKHGYAAATRSRMLSTLRGLCKWLVLEGYIQADPSIRLENPKPDQRYPAAFSSDDLARILDAASSPDPTARDPWPLRDRAMVAVLAGAGLRASELTGLTINSLVRDAPIRLRVIGKGNKERAVPVAPEIVAAIDDYLRDRTARDRAPEPAAPMFVRSGGKPFTRQTLDYLTYKWIKRAGVIKPEGEAVHAFRHTYAKGLVASGASLASVQALLGHASLNTTQVYLRMTGVELADAAMCAEIRPMLRRSS